jgi:sugar phosphate isomerase/epimerase
VIGACSTGALTRYPEYPDHRRILTHPLPVQLELSIYRGWDEHVAEELAALPFLAAHAEKSIGASFSGDAPDFGGLALSCRIAVLVGAPVLVLHLWELPDGDRKLGRNLDALPRCLDLCDEHGLTLAVETIPCSVGSPVDNVLRACERDDRCRVVLDTEFLALHGELGRAGEVRERVVHVHAKDFDRSLWEVRPRPWNRYLIPGEGTVDVDAFLDELAWKGTVTLELSAVLPTGEIDADRLEKGLEWLRRLSA